MNLGKNAQAEIEPNRSCLAARTRVEEFFAEKKLLSSIHKTVHLRDKLNRRRHPEGYSRASAGKSEGPCGFFVNHKGSKAAK